MIKYETFCNDIKQYAIWKLGKNHSYTVKLITVFDTLSNDIKELFEHMTEEQLDKIFFVYANAIDEQVKKDEN